MRSQPAAPRPQEIRKCSSGFGWLDASLLHDGWLAQLGSEAIAVLAFLALAADRNGVSYYARDSMALATGLDVARVDRALDLLVAEGLLAHRPWRRSRRDGVWQLLPVPRPQSSTRAAEMLSAQDLLERLGFSER